MAYRGMTTGDQCLNEMANYNRKSMLSSTAYCLPVFPSRRFRGKRIQFHLVAGSNTRVGVISSRYLFRFSRLHHPIVYTVTVLTPGVFIPHLPPVNHHESVFRTDLIVPGPRSIKRFPQPLTSHPFEPIARVSFLPSLFAQ